MKVLDVIAKRFLLSSFIQLNLRTGEVPHLCNINFLRSPSEYYTLRTLLILSNLVEVIKYILKEITGKGQLNLEILA